MRITLFKNDKQVGWVEAEWQDDGSLRLDLEDLYRAEEPYNPDIWHNVYDEDDLF